MIDFFQSQFQKLHLRILKRSLQNRKKKGKGSSLKGSFRESKTVRLIPG